jgi:hypothetical protein
MQCDALYLLDVGPHSLDWQRLQRDRQCPLDALTRSDPLR